jgi:hypothetical protein
VGCEGVKDMLFDRSWIIRGELYTIINSDGSLRCFEAEPGDRVPVRRGGMDESEWPTPDCSTNERSPVRFRCCPP